MFAGIAKPINAPKMEEIDAINAIGITRRKSARLVLRSLGLAASAPAKAISKPAPLTKSRWKGKKPLTIGTNKTPPPTPPRTPTMPIKKLTTNSANGHTHQLLSTANELLSAKTSLPINDKQSKTDKCVMLSD